jgi:hypothetical protein
LFDAVAEGRLLILSPWPFDPKKKQVTRAECVAMNHLSAPHKCGFFSLSKKNTHFSCIYQKKVVPLQP